MWVALACENQGWLSSLKTGEGTAAIGPLSIDLVSTWLQNLPISWQMTVLSILGVPPFDSWHLSEEWGPISLGHEPMSCSGKISTPPHPDGKQRPLLNDSGPKVLPPPPCPRLLWVFGRPSWPRFQRLHELVRLELLAHLLGCLL